MRKFKCYDCNHEREVPFGAGESGELIYYTQRRILRVRGLSIYFPMRRSR